MKSRYIVIFMAFVLAACSADKGNYDYRSLKEPVITGIDADISVLTFSRLQISPDLGGDFPASEYAFEWRALPLSGSGEIVILSESRVLDYEVTLYPGAYTLLFKVVERANGVYWQTRSSLQVSEATSEGWMVLCSEGSEKRVRLDMISAVTGQTYTDILKDSGMPALYGPRKIFWSRYADRNSPYYLLAESGATRLGRNGFGWQEEYRMKYEMGINLDNPCPATVVDAPVAKIMVSGGRPYYASCFVGVGLFGNLDDGNLVNVAPEIGCNISTQSIMVPVSMFYDLDSKSFMGYAPNLRINEVGGYAPLHEMNDLVTLLGEMDKGGMVIGSAFGKFPQGMDYVYMENTKYDPNNTNMGMIYAVLKDSEGYYLYGIQLGELWSVSTVGDCSYAIGKAYYGELTQCVDIANASHFAFSSLHGYMYYSVGGIVYRVDLSEPALSSTVQFDLGAENVTCLKFNLYEENVNKNRSYDLVVGSVSGDEGRVRIYEGFESGGDFRNVQPVTYDGLGQVVDVTYREMLK